MKVTKKAKSVTVYAQEIPTTLTYNGYKCPSCGTCFTNCGPSENVLRFICKCGQELIVAERIKTNQKIEDIISSRRRIRKIETLH